LHGYEANVRGGCRLTYTVDGEVSDKTSYFV
jgi:hypothetical protein